MLNCYSAHLRLKAVAMARECNRFCAVSAGVFNVSKTLLADVVNILTGQRR